MTPAQAPPPAPKKSKLLLWIFLGVGGLIMIAVIGVAATFFFIAHKVKQAGFDADLIKSNPAMAITKMMAATNPDIDVLSYDDKTGTIKVKDKKTGKIMEMNFEDAKNGNFTIKEEGGKEGKVSISGSGGNPPPDWVPVYPGAKQQSSFSSNTEEGSNGTVAFNVDGGPKEIAEFYREKLKAKGFAIAAEFSGGGGAGSMLTAEDKDKNRAVHVVIGGEGSKATVSVTFTEKKKE
jgi:hypothetical protein